MNLSVKQGRLSSDTLRKRTRARVLEEHMRAAVVIIGLCATICPNASGPAAEIPDREVSADGLKVVSTGDAVGSVTRCDITNRDLPFGAEPDWAADLRRQVGGLSLADLDLDADLDLVVGCYHSSSYPPYEDWHNLIYFNLGTGLETSPSWVSSD